MQSKMLLAYYCGIVKSTMVFAVPLSKDNTYCGIVPWYTSLYYLGWPKKIKVGNTFLHNAAPVTLQNARMHAKFWTD